MSAEESAAVKAAMEIRNELIECAAGIAQKLYHFRWSDDNKAKDVAKVIELGSEAQHFVSTAAAKADAFVEQLKDAATYA